MPNRLARLLNIRAGEERLVLLMMLYSAFIGVCISYFFTASSALFLSRYAIENLPYVFVLSGLVLLLAQIGYQWAAARLTASQLLVGSLAVVAGGTAALRLGLAMGEAGWLIFSLFIWFRLMIMLLRVGFWGLANRLFNLEQSKRLFSVISAVNVLSGIVGSFAVPLVVGVIGTENLYLVVVFAAIICLATTLTIQRRYRHHLAASERASEPKLREGARLLFKNRYLLHILAIYLLAWTLNYLIDFAFFERLQSRFADEPEKIAGFIGVMFGAIYTANFLLKFFFSGWLIGRYGLRVALLVLPVGFAVGVFSSGLSGIIAGAAALFFWAVIATKFSEEVLRETMNEPATRILYQPLPSEQRASVLAWVEGTGYPLTAILAGAILSLFTLTDTFSALGTVLVMAALAAAWVALAARVYGEYVHSLRSSLNRRAISGAELVFKDAATVALLRGRLKSPYPGEVIYALDLLEKLDGDGSHYVSDLLGHPSPVVRREALQRIQSHHLTPNAELIFVLAEEDHDPEVRAAALRVFCALKPPNLLEKVLPCLEHPDPAVKRGALIGLLNQGGGQGMEAAEAVLLNLTRSASTADRSLAAEVLGEVDNKRFAGYMANLLTDSEPAVQRAAFLAAGKLNNPQFWPIVLKGLAQPAVATAAASALFMANRSIYPLMETVFSQPDSPRRLLVNIARVCGRRRDAQAITLLESQFNHPDKLVRYQVRSSLSLCNYQASGAMVEKVHAAIHEEAAEAAWILGAQRDLDADPTFALVEDALANELEYLRGRLFTLLSFLYEGDAILRIRDNLRGGAADKRLYAQETLEIMLSKLLKNLCLPLLGDLRPEERLARLQGQFPQPTLEAQARLLALITHPLSDWIKACALYALAGQPSEAARQAVLSAAESSDRLVRETAAWTLHRLNRSPTAHPIMKKQKGNLPMLLTIEKVLILKSVGIFSRVPDPILTEVAAALEEVDLSAGEDLFREGEAGASMYIIVSGKIRIHTAAKVVADRGEREFIGEMSLFDNQPRSASATALEETRLLRLEQDAFDDLLANHPDMARGIIHELANRLREMMQQHGVSPIMSDIYDRILAGRA